MTQPIDPVDFSVDLSGRVALVTGTTSGLGRRFAEVLALSGAAVVLTGRREDRLAEVADAIGSVGGTCLPLTLDVADPAAIVAVIDRAEAELGLVDILVNNAGVPDAKRAHRMPLEVVDHVIEVNLRAPWLLSTEVARRLIDAGRPGRIVNIASMTAINYDGHGAALYSTTKAGLIRMTEALAVEWAKYDINVNCIAPGAFATEMMDGMVERMGDFSGRFPRKRFAEPIDLDGTLLYLVSPSSRVVTGALITANDGQSAR